MIEKRNAKRIVSSEWGIGNSYQVLLSKFLLKKTSENYLLV
jgi:hypothetical protein